MIYNFGFVKKRMLMMAYPEMNESLRDIIYFVATARAQSMTSAAEELGIVKSTIGKSIARLEEQLGAVLFHRTTRRVHLTTEGELYFQSCVDALNILSAAEKSLKLKSEAPSGVVRIDMPTTIGRHVVLPILLNIAKQYPELKLTLTFNDRVIDPAGEGFDLALRYGPVEDSSELIARQLTTQQLVLCTSPDYIQKYGCPATIDELVLHRCIVAWRGNKPLNWRLKNTNQKEIQFSPVPHHQMNDGDAILAASVAGEGIAQFPIHLIKNELASGQLVLVLPDTNPEPVPLSLVWPRKRHLMPGIRYIINELVKFSENQLFD